MISMAAATRLTLSEYLGLEYPFVVSVDPDEGGYVVTFPDLPGCVTQVESLDDLPAMVEDVRALWLEAAFENGIEIPLPSLPNQYSGKFVVRLPRALHRRLAESAECEGISLNQYVVSLLAERDAIARVERRLNNMATQGDAILTLS
jgi:antitoxin HicB